MHNLILAHGKDYFMSLFYSPISVYVKIYPNRPLFFLFNKALIKLFIQTLRPKTTYT